MAKHRRAFREVVKEGLLKACRVKVSIPSLVKMGSALVGSRPKTLSCSSNASRWCGNKAIFSRSAESFPISFVTSSNFAGPVKVRSTDDIEVLGLEEGIFGVFSQNGMIWCEGS